MLHDAFSKPQLVTSSPLASKTLAELTHTSVIRHSLATPLALWRQPESTLPTPNAPKMSAPDPVSLQAQSPVISALSCPSSTNGQQEQSRASSCQFGLFLHHLLYLAYLGAAPSPYIRRRPLWQVLLRLGVLEELPLLTQGNFILCSRCHVRAAGPEQQQWALALLKWL